MAQGYAFGSPISVLVWELSLNSLQHCSLAEASACTGKVLREYFLDGKLPENGTVCGVEENRFPKKLSAHEQSTSQFGWTSGEASLAPKDLDISGKMKAFGEAAQEEVRRNAFLGHRYW